MGMTVIKCFSVLVAAGQGKKCQELKKKIRDQLLFPEEELGQLKVSIFKYGKQLYPNIYYQIASDLTKNISPLFKDVPDVYFGEDNAKNST